MNRYPIFSARNLPAYVTVMLLCAVASVRLALLLRTVTAANAVGWTSALAFADVAVTSGMAIMFGASVVNLSKLRPGFEALASGEVEPSIPPVWYPVLTMATRSAVNLSNKVRASRMGSPSDGIGTRKGALNVDPEAAAQAYRDRIVGPYRGKLPPAIVKSMEEFNA